MKPLLSIYKPGFAVVIVYMLQNVEYRPGPYLRWFWRTQNFDTVTRRRTLHRTRPARLLLLALRTGMFLQFAIGVGFILQWLWQGLPAGWQFGLALILSYPIIWAHLVTIPLALGDWLIIRPRQRRAIKMTEKLFGQHQGVRIAVIGSYGKTTMKELLQTVLSEGKKVAVTPGNKNVAISHAYFAQKLTKDEEVLVIEYGEGQPGDIRRFSHNTHPTHAVITGLAPAHLDRYKTLANVAADLFSIAETVSPKHIYVNTEADSITDYTKDDMQAFDTKSALGWQIGHIKLAADSTSFTLTKAKHKLNLTSGLIGRHNVAPLAFVAAFALELGLTEQQVLDGVAKTMPFEHRMQPRQLNGATLIDDTYNGNLQGITVGTQLLGELEAKRKWYVTPGLVDQGADADDIHRQMGVLIAAAKPDIVVLMANSAQPYILAGLESAGYAGEVRIERDPLQFYTNLPHFVASGDLIMMQNDWTDNYA
jgi:UDP-N-acetylmuramoyl-tripeptide--D-alanyl-D-alanine ligase